jgi:5-methyltetrahydropteroyltriglutamate--homocysteine methyltransferase
MLTQNLGYPRIGAKRELKKACENYWAGKISEEELHNAGMQERKKNWLAQKEVGIDLIPCNDFSFYDQVQDMNFMLGAIPKRFQSLINKLTSTDLYFAMCRGYQKEGFDLVAMEITKWFDTNYHFIVPEFNKDQHFFIYSKKPFNEFIEAKELGINEPKPVLIGPVSYLLLGKEKEEGFHRLELINNLLPVYIEILKELKDLGCNYVQLDEPFLVTELDGMTQSVYKKVYHEINKSIPELKVILTTYFDELGENTKLSVNLPAYALHIDLASKPEQLNEILKLLPKERKLSLGIIDGRNIWKNNFKESLKRINLAIESIGKENVWLAPSCSLLHCPYDLDMENNAKILPEEVKQWMSFSKQKLQELQILKELKNEKDTISNEALETLGKNSRSHSDRRNSALIQNILVKEKVEKLLKLNINRLSDFETRNKKQQDKFKFNLYPTTTIGSFPQTIEVRKKRKAYKNETLSAEEYEDFLKTEIEKAVRWQEEIGIDVLVHGEFERNDMVEYFGELLEGFAFTENGWVQSYGSRGVKPPVIYGDVSRREPMTVKWSEYAQSLTSKKMKGMLTGPVTILQWSFVRDDQPREITTYQIANALHDEVLDLEKAGIDIIQIDEPALREGLPLKNKDWPNYLEWAVKAFKVCSLGVSDQTQIHTHMCYAEFNDIITAIAAMDADVISIETSRSQMELLDVFKVFKYPNQIGPGVYDIHSPRIPDKKEITNLIIEAKKYVSEQQIWINPDCGLKTRSWDQVKPALENMVQAAKLLREQKKY